MRKRDVPTGCRWLAALVLNGLVLLWFVAAAPAGAAPVEWTGTGADGEPTVHLYFFWSRNCSHCREALPFIETLEREQAWLRLHSHEVSLDRDNRDLYRRMARELGAEARSVPAFMFCGTMLTGYDSADTTGDYVLRRLAECRQRIAAGGGAVSGQGMAPPDVYASLPGSLNAQSMSLPLLTLVLAGLDAFNPCAFFILLFLLSLLVHARSRSRMLLIGGVFVLFSGVIYFLFMAAWLNAFLLAGRLQWITPAAALLAIAFAAINIKDYFLFRRGITLGIPDAAKPGLFGRMRGLLNANSLPAMFTATVLLAITANGYELLCTAGFPMVYTRVLTLNELAPSAYYLYLAFYNAIYVLPLVVIVGLFVATLGSRRLSEYEGRVLKLVSGLMMLALGSVLLVAPAALSRPETALAVPAVALLAAVIIMRVWPAYRGRGKAGDERSADRR